MRRRDGAHTWGAVGRTTPRSLRLACFRRDDWTCQRCGYTSPRRDGRDLIADHIHNLARGGSRALENLQTLCPSCHQPKTQTEALIARGIAPRRRVIHPADMLGGFPNV